MTIAASIDSRPEPVSKAEMRKVIFGASLGAVFEWYDFFLYAFLAVFFSSQFFPRGNETAALLASLTALGAGFVVRPLGALMFGHLGDIIGRKYTFLITIVVMGVATAAIGLLPTFEQIGWAAPILLVTLRLLQGFSLGGEFSGAAIYTVEHADDNKRGAETGWLQTTTSIGQMLAIGAIFACRSSMDSGAFAQWGWRIPFFLSIILLFVSVYIRLRLHESPIFLEMKRLGKGSAAPISEAFGDLRNVKVIGLAILVAGGMGSLAYAGQIYAIIFLETVLKFDRGTIEVFMAIVIFICLPFNLYFAKLSDRFGRKRVLLTGCLLGALSVIPTFHILTHFTNPALEEFQAQVKVTVAADNCRTHIIVTPITDMSACDRARNLLTAAGVNYVSLPGNGTDDVVTTIGDHAVTGFDAAAYKSALDAAGYPEKADPARVNEPVIFLCLLLLTFFAAWLNGPLSVFLVEQFATRVRYTSTATAQNLGVGWLGGLSPLLVSAVSIATGNVYAGLWYPVIVPLVAVVVVGLFLKDRTGRNFREF